MTGIKKHILLAVLVCALSALGCMLLFRYDNKYTAPGPRGVNGLLTLSDTDIRRGTFLIDGWAIYGGGLLAPEDFRNGGPRPDDYVFIGQYGGFEKFIGTPHGSVTYRLTVLIPKSMRSYTLAMPEVFSSCRVYINGIERLALGEPSPETYRFETGNVSITFDASRQIDILVAVSDFSHLYSGMVYPPMLGAPDAVSQMLSARITLRSAVLAAALLIGVISLFVGLLSGRRGLSAMYGLLCLLFAGYVCYPVTITLARGSVWLYAMESVSFCTMLLVVIAMQDMIYTPSGNLGKIRLVMLCFGALPCLAALVMPFLLSFSALPVMMAYSQLITFYQIITAGYITFMAGLSVWKRTVGGASLFWGMLVLDCTLVADRILHPFEPVLSGWFPEIGSFALVFSLGIATAREIIRGYRESAVMEERVRVMITSGRDHYQKMDEMYEKLRILRHDYKYHLNAVRNMIKTGASDDVEQYLTVAEDRLSAHEIPQYCSDAVINALIDSYAERCAKLAIRFDVEIAIPESPGVPNYDLCIILGNLLENAVEACERLPQGRTIWVKARNKPTQILIMVQNSFNGAVQESNGSLVSAKTNGGFGLRSVKEVIARHGGDLLTEWEEGLFTVYVTVQGGSDI